MHLIRKDYIFFYDEGIVCYKATPVSPKKVVKRDLNNKNKVINISPKIEEYKTNYINEPQISLVPNKPLNLFEYLVKDKEELLEEIKEISEPKIRPCIALNTLYSLVYPITEAGNTHVFSRKEESEVKNTNKYYYIPTYNKKAKGLYKFPNDINCNKCAPLNRFDREDYIYTCPETISPHKTTDLLINKYILRKKPFIDNHCDLGQQYTAKAKGQSEITLTYKIVREKTFTDDTVERKVSDDKESVLDDYELTSYEEEVVKPESEPKYDNRDIVINTTLDKLLSDNNPTILSIIKSVDYDPVVIDRLANYQKPGIARILSNKEISEVIESPNVISSPQSFSRQLSKLPSVKTVSNASKTPENEPTSQHPTRSVDDPLEPKLSEISNVSTVKSEHSRPPLKSVHSRPPLKSNYRRPALKSVYSKTQVKSKDSTPTPKSDYSTTQIKTEDSRLPLSTDKSDVGSQEKVPFYSFPVEIKPIRVVRKKPLPPLISQREPISIPAVASEETTGGSIKAPEDSPIEPGLDDRITSDENLNTPIVPSENPEISDYQTNELTSQEPDVPDTRQEDEVIDQEEEYEKKTSETHETVEPMEVESVEPDKEVKAVEENDDETAIVPKEPGEVYINAKNKEVIRPLKNNKNKVLINGFEATVFVVNSKKSATSAFCTVMFNYENDVLIIKSEKNAFEIKATDLTSEEIPTSPGSPILLKIALNNRISSAIVLQTYARRNLEILAGTIGWVKNRDKEEFGDKAPRMNVRRSLFAGIKGNKRKDRVSNGNDNNGQGTNKTEETWLSKEEEKERPKKKFNRMKRRQKALDAAKYY